MTRNKTKRMRGSRNAGWGKHHRNKGNKGGSGNAGRGKRSAHKKPSFRGKELGGYGFTSKSRTKRDNTISLKEVEMKLVQWTKEGLVTEKHGVPHVDLEKLGYTKLLSTGTLKKNISIHVKKASKKAVAKLGGESA